MIIIGNDDQKFQTVKSYTNIHIATLSVVFVMITDGVCWGVAVSDLTGEDKSWICCSFKCNSALCLLDCKKSKRKSALSDMFKH